MPIKIDNPDTDGDKLPDGYEVINLDTDPLEIDTDGNGISDADEDFDSDNLNNLGEFLNKTEPFNPDTDEDGLLDGDEIKKYKTDPLNPDTDNDKLLDGEEDYDGTIYKRYGVYFDPLNPDTNGNGILDGDEVFGQSKKQTVSTNDEAITEIKVDMNTNGSLERNLTIESMQGIDAMSSNVYAMIGEPFNFTSETSFDSATITFKVDKSKLGDSKFDNLIILWYNEEKQIFEEMPTTRSWEKSTVSTTTTHFSQYLIVDSEKWYDNWEESFRELRKMWKSSTTYYKAMNTILVVDCSWKMDSADPISYSIEVGYNGVTEENHSEILSYIHGTQSNIDYYMEKYGRRLCSRASICENIIGNMGGGDSAAVIMYSDHIESNTGLTGSTGPLYSAVQGVNSDGNSLWLNGAVQTALSYVSDSDSEMYRIIVITNKNVSYGYELSSYNYTNVSLNIVSLGGGNIGSDLENIVYDTYGDVYYGYPSSDLTNVTGNTIELPPQFEGEDSDGDGIPDLVELYGLKPDGHPMNTDPFKKDTDGDGLDDNIELNFVTEKLTSAVSMVEYYSAIGYSSDPTMTDTDWDTYDDKKEYELGSNPSVANFYIENEDYEFVMNNDYYNSDAYRNLYNNSAIAKAYVGLGNYVFGSNYSKVELYKTAIIEYLDRTLNSKKTVYESQEWMELEKSIYEQYNDTVGIAYKALEASGKPIDITQRDIKLLKDFQAKMRENLKIISSAGNQASEKAIARIKQASLDFEYLSSQIDSVSKKINFKNMSIEFIDGSVKTLGAFLDFANITASAIDTYSNYTKFKSNVRIMEEGINLLETFTQSDDVNVKKAALQLLDYANEEYEKAHYEWIQALESIGEDVIGLQAFTIISKLPKYGSYASLFLVVSDWTTNIGETAMQAEYTFANATVAESLRKEISRMAKTGDKLQNGISISRDYKAAARKFVDLIVLRINAEEQYIAYSKAFPWYSEWLDKDNQEHAQGNINKLNDILEKYT